LFAHSGQYWLTTERLTNPIISGKLPFAAQPRRQPEEITMRAALLALNLVVLPAVLCPAGAQTADRLYVMDCGHNAAGDQARWSPGVNVGKPIELSDTCTLVKHGNQWLLWDTGYPDAIADKPVENALGRATRARKLAAQLDELGVKPRDIAFVAVSHTHGDHVGNVDMFPDSTLLIQKAELDWAFAEGKQPPFRKDRPTRPLTGDLDVFGDGSVVLLSTPGHTPGHQSLLVHLARTGWLVLTGDAAHFRDNWDHDRVPSMNTDAAQTHASHARIEKILAEKKATLWINHDLPTFTSLKHSPQAYD
jgi:N-acyl homoserine lactone hydrolase